MQLNPLIQLKTTDVQPEGGCVDALQIDAPDSVGSAEDGFGRLYSEEALQDAALGTETFSLNPWSSLTDSSDAMPVQPSDVAATGFSFVLGELNAEKEAIEEKEEGLSVESKVSVAMLSGKDAERLDIAESDFGTDSPDSTEDLSVQTIPNLARTESEVVQLDAQTGTVEFVVKDADREDQVADWENGISSSSRHVGTGGLVMISSRGDKARIVHVTAEEVSDTRTASVADMPTIASPLKQDAGEDGGRLVRVQMNRSANESVAVDAFTAVVSKQTELLDAQQSGITGSAAASVTPMMLEMSRGLHKVLSAADKPAPPDDAKEAVVLAAQTKGAFSRQTVMAETKDMPEVSGRPTTTVTTTEPLLPNSGGSDGKTASVATIQPQSVAEGFAGNTVGGPVSEELMVSGSETFPALPLDDRKAARSPGVADEPILTVDDDSCRKQCCYGKRGFNGLDFS